MVDTLSVTISFLVAGPAYILAGMTWLESRKQRKLLETVTKALPYVRRSRFSKRTVVPKSRSLRATDAASSSAPSAPTIRPPNTGKLIQERREERKRLELEFKREQEHWRRQKDVAKAIGWFIDRLSDDEGEDDEP
jgi:hypothetical protein